MKKFKTNFSKNGIIALILAMVLVFPNLDVYSCVDSYATDSFGLRANSVKQLEVNKVHKNVPNALAWAVGGLVAGSAANHYYGDAQESAWNKFDNAITGGNNNFANRNQASASDFYGQCYYQESKGIGSPQPNNNKQRRNLDFSKFDN